MCCFGAMAPGLETDKTKGRKIWKGNRQLTKQFIGGTDLNKIK